MNSCIAIDARHLTLCTLFLIFVSTASAQPGESVEDLKRQLRQMQGRINNLQSNEDPFGKRVRSVGRQRAPKNEPIQDEFTIRFYDLSDVFSVAPQYPAQIATDFNNRTGNLFPIAGMTNGSRGQFMSGGGFGGGGGGLFNLPPAQQQPQPTSVQAARVSMESLVGAVKQTVSPDEWDDSNGDASISILGNTLLISATESMHEQIANLMDLFREQWGKLKTVSVQAFWIESDSAQVSELLDSDAKNPIVGKVNGNKWSQFLGKANEEKRVAYSASLCGQNGQTLHTVSGQQHYVVLNADPIYTFHGTRELIEDEDVDMLEQSLAGLKPVRTLFQEGAAIQVSPLATRGGKFVILDLHTRVNEYSKTEGANANNIVARGKNGNELSMPLENRPFISYRLSTTVRCPNNEVVLAGGMTYDNNQDVSQSDLYLFVKTNIHTIEEDHAK